MATPTERAKMRPGFLLPMALVLTAITAVVVGGLASYCTTSFRTSELYLSRTRCRLAAQSAIEEAKLRFQAEITKSGKGGLIADPTNAGFSKSMADLADAVNATFPATTNINGCVVRVQAGTAGMDSNETVIPFFATATYGNSNTSVTLQENVKFVVSDTDAYKYAYFANSDGFLESSYVTVNGDVRANGNFTVNAAEINGYIYATNEVKLINNPKIRTAKSYNNNFNSNSSGWFSGNSFYFPAYSQVRPTNPLYPTGIATNWTGGFEGLAGNYSGAQTITKTSRSAQPHNKAIVQEKQSVLSLPKIEGFGNDTGLGYYKNYAASQNGSLICSNCTVTSEGAIYQLRTTALTLNYTITYTEDVDAPELGYDYISGSEWYSKGEPSDWSEDLTPISKSDYDQISSSLDKSVTWTECNYNQYRGRDSYYDWKYTGLFFRKYYRGQCNKIQYKRVKKKTITKTKPGSAEKTRELRSIRVRQGYQIDHTGLSERDCDLSGTTANLRPFRAFPAEEHTNLAQIGMQNNADKGAVILIGTWDFPIVINGPVVFESDVLIRGFVQGKGTIYSGRNIHIIGDINYKNAPKWSHDNSGSTLPSNSDCDFLALISKGSIVIGNYVNDSDWTDSSDGVKKYISGTKSDDMTTSRKYTKTDYTAVDSSCNADGRQYKKVVFKDNDFDETTVLKYESVVGDWVFGIDTSFEASYDENAEGMFSPYFDDKERASYYSDAIENYLNDAEKNLSYRQKTPFRSFVSSLASYCGGTVFSRHYATNDGSIYPYLNCIRKINAVLYSSGGIFGTFGGKGGSKSFAVINGAVIGQDECIIPFARRFYKCYFTINWDMRLSKKSAESMSEIGLPKGSGDGENKPYTFSWQEVPDNYNPANP